MKYWLVCIALLLWAILATCVEAQEAEAIPPHLKLKGDPAAGLDLGSARFVPMGRRKGDDGQVAQAAYLCRTTHRQKQQAEPAGIAVAETLLGRPTSAVLPYLNRLSPEKNAHVIWTRHATLVGLLDEGPAKSVTAEEWIRLQVFFPQLKKDARKLTGLQRTHLWAIRLLQSEAKLADLLELDGEGRLKEEESGSRPVAHRRYEMYLFSSEKEYDSFRSHIFPPDTEPLVGSLIQNVPVPVPVSAVLLKNGSARALQRRFLFSATLLSLARHRRMAGGLPPWLVLGIAHFIERRGMEGKKDRDDSGTLPGTTGGIKNWDAFVRDLIIGRKAADIVSLTAAGHESMTPSMRVQSSSMVRFMVGAGRKRFAKMMNLLYRSEPRRARVLSINDAVGLSYNVELRTLEKAWRQWAGTKK